MNAVLIPQSRSRPHGTLPRGAQGANAAIRARSAPGTLLALAVAALAFGAASDASAQNDCDARVSVASSTRAPNDDNVWIVTFAVSTPRCDASAGRFEYAYRLKGTSALPSTKTVPQWYPGLGRTFVWNDELRIRPGQEIEFVAVDSTSIASAPAG